MAKLHQPGPIGLFVNRHPFSPPLRTHPAVNLLLEVATTHLARNGDVALGGQLLVQPADDLVGGGNPNAHIVRYIL